jgi:ribosomal protein S8
MSTARSDRIGLPEVFKFAEEAVISMLETADSAEDSILNFSERQLEHEIGATLNGEGFVTCYDFCYPDSNFRADILTYLKYGLQTDPCIWLEIKFTSYRDDNLSQLDYLKDFEKLAIPKDGMWKCPHRAYWIWLHLFDRKNSSVELPPVHERSWLRDMTIEQITQKLKDNENLTTLCTKVQDISKNNGIKDIVFSIIPAPDPRTKNLAALLLVARLC